MFGRLHRPVIGRRRPDQVARAAGSEAPCETTQEFGSWVLRCDETLAGSKPVRTACELVQDVLTRQADRDVSVPSVGFTRAEDQKSLVVTVRLPLALRVKPGLIVSGDDGHDETLAYDLGGPRGCWVTGAPADALLKTLKVAKTGRVKVILADSRTLTIEFPTTGLTDGLAALDKTLAEKKCRDRAETEGKIIA